VSEFFIIITCFTSCTNSDSFPGDKPLDGHKCMGLFGLQYWTVSTNTYCFTGKNSSWCPFF